MVTQEEFDKAAEDVKNLNSTPSDDDMLELYSFYKQSTTGDVDIEKPGGLLNFKAKAKWDAWHKVRGTKTEDAMTAYVQKVQSLVETIGLKS